MGLRDDLLRGIYNFGFEKPSAIQQRAIIPITSGRDVIAQAQYAPVIVISGRFSGDPRRIWWERGQCCGRRRVHARRKLNPASLRPLLQVWYGQDGHDLHHGSAKY